MNTKKKIEELEIARTHLTVAIIKFRDVGFSVKSLLDYQSNIKMHIELLKKGWGDKLNE